LKPHQVAMYSNKKCWFDCPTCPHLFCAQPGNVTSSRPTWCPYCAGKKLCENYECQHCFERSFASHPKAKYWSDKNTKTPRDFALHSNKKNWFDCEEGHDFSTSLTNVAFGKWCPHCTHKTEKKLYEWFQAQTWVKEVKHGWRPRWCSTQYMWINTKGDFKVSRRQYAFDFRLTLHSGQVMVVELDGRQHYEQVWNWKKPLCQQIRDKYKERVARKNGIVTIRVMQEDVWHDKNNWDIKMKNVIIIKS